MASLFEQLETGDEQAVDEQLPTVYNELRRLARRQLANELPGQSLQTTDLAHDAFLRLAGSNQQWHGHGHFLAAAAEAMRRILVERARKKRRVKHGGRFVRVELTDSAATCEPTAEEVIMVSDLLESLAKLHPLEAQIVKLHYFAGLDINEAAGVIGVSTSKAYRYWTFARAWLHEAIHGQEDVEQRSSGVEQQT
jgi:RNA polymerase sigma factor (TIGR02999 family)